MLGLHPQIDTGHNIVTCNQPVTQHPPYLCEFFAVSDDIVLYSNLQHSRFNVLKR